MSMRLWRKRHGEAALDAVACQHIWRVREASEALSGAFHCYVCDGCGAVHLDTNEAPESEFNAVENDNAPRHSMGDLSA